MGTGVRMSQRSRSLLASWILLLGLLAVVWGRPDLLAMHASQVAHTWVVDVDTWRRTPYQRVVRSPFDFDVRHDLHRIPLDVGGWHGVDVPQTNLEVFILLKPEQYLQRRYTYTDGQFLWLSIIGSRKERSFHPPEICYMSDGWQAQVSDVEVPLRRGSIRALKVLAHKGRWHHLVLYFFVWPDQARDLARGVVMFKVTVPVSRGEEDALALAKAFIRTFFWEVVE